jgi:hypothetical protein
MDHLNIQPQQAIVAALLLYARGEPFAAHEVLEEAWHAAGRAGDTASLLKALIRLCAARVKLQQGNPVGVASHTAGAAQLVAELPGTALHGVTFAAIAEEIAGIRAGRPPNLQVEPAPADG